MKDLGAKISMIVSVVCIIAVFAFTTGAILAYSGEGGNIGFALVAGLTITSITIVFTSMIGEIFGPKNRQ